MAGFILLGVVAYVALKMCIRDSFTIEQIKKTCEKEEFISNSEGYHFDESKFDDFDTAKDVYKRQPLNNDYLN